MPKEIKIGLMLFVALYVIALIIHSDIPLYLLLIIISIKFIYDTIKDFKK